MPLILRTNKTEPLTHTELDGNLSHLDQRITALTNAEANKIITWTEIQSKPVLFDGDYNSLSNLPSLFNGDYNSLTNTPVTFDGNYQSLTNKPGIPSNLADLANVQNTAPGIEQVLTWNGSSWAPQDKFSADYNDLTNKPLVPTLLGDLSNVSPTAPATDEVLKWDGSQWAPGSDVGNIPTYAEVTDKNTANGPSKIAIGTIAGSTNQGNLAVAIGYEAGKTNQGANSIAIGVNAGETTQSTNATAVGISAGETTQGANATALGYYAGNANQGSEAVAIGDLAGSTNQGANATAVGNSAGEDTQGVSAVAIGDVAGALNQNTFAVAVGASAGMTSQGQAAVAIGKNSGETLQGSDTVAIGNSAGNANQTAKAVAVGDWAGKTDQGASAVALGHLAGTTNQGQYATALGHYAGANDQSSNAIAVGYNAAYENQGSQAIAIGASSANNQSANAIAIGSSAANNTQGEEAIAIGKQAGNGTQGTQAIAIGTDSGLTTQSDFAIAIGQEAGKTTQGTLALAVGNSAGVTLQGDGAVALGYTAGNANQGNLAIAIGNAAGTTTQGIKAIAIGEEAGNTNQGVTAIALGSDAGKTSQGNDGIAIGTSAALVTQGVNSVAIGRLAANNDQGANAVAIGDSAGKTTQGDYAIAIGNAAGETNQAANSIVINATSTAVENTTADSFVVKPIRNGNGTHQLEYNPTTGEITYDALGAGGYGDADVFTYLNVTFANDGDVLSWDTTAGDYAWVAQTSGSSSSYSDSDAIAAVVGADLDMGGNKVLFGNVYATSGDLPVAASYHGMFAHVHATGKGYFAHGGNWVELANAADIPTITGHSNLIAWDLSDAANSKVLDAGTSIDTAWYYGDVVSDPANPNTSVVLDIGAATPTFSGNVMGEVHGDVYNPTGANKILESGTGNLDSILTVDTANATTLNATTTNISGIATFTGSSVDFTGTTTMGSWNGPVYDRTGGTLIIEDDATPNPIVHADLDGDVTGNITSSGSSEFSGTVDFTGASVSGLPSGGSGLQSRSTVTGTTSSLADAAEADLDITGFKAYTLLTITTDRAARVRLYVNNATRTADAARAEGVDPTSDAGLIAEVITTGADTVIISPGAYGFNLESSPTTTIPCRVTNKSGSASTVKVDLNILQLEA